jgi:hypothetical protein
MLKKLMFVMVAVMTLTVGVISFDGGHKVEAATYAGTAECTTIDGMIGQLSIYWKYSAGTCWNYADSADHFIVAWINNTPAGGYNTDPYLVYLDRWNSSTSTWDEVAHTGSYYDGTGSITTNDNNTDYHEVRFYYEYGGVPLNTAVPYRLRLSNPDSPVYVTTRFLN